MWKPTYYGLSDYKHGQRPKIGVLIANLGTPDEPTTESLKTYLAEFLADPRVIEASRPYWWLIRKLFILRKRPQESAKLYQSIWTERGSPLRWITEDTRDALRERFHEFDDSIVIEYAMRYGNPSTEKVLKSMAQQGVTKLFVLPLYPQYSGTTIGSTFDELARVLRGFRWVPELRMLNGYCDHPLYIKALATTIREAWKDREPEKIVFSYHGIPLSYFLGGDPYHCECHKTTRLVMEELGVSRDKAVVCFQSVFGKDRWIEPPTIDTIRAMAKDGVKRLDVICPGFSADCLETIEEIDVLNREAFTESGGDEFRYIPCLNVRKDAMDLYQQIVEEHISPWVIRFQDRAEQLRASNVSRLEFEKVAASVDYRPRTSG